MNNKTRAKRPEPLGTGGWFVRSAEGTRSRRGITRLGIEEWRRQGRVIVERIRKQNQEWS